jgi:hypothetical protein
VTTTELSTTGTARLGDGIAGVHAAITAQNAAMVMGPSR